MADNYVIAFDMLETLLDLSALDDAFREHFGGSRVRYEWFAEVHNLMLAFAAADRYESVSDIGEAALKFVEERHRQKLSWWNRKEILQRFRQVPAFPDAAPALQRLHSAKIRLVVLTNTARKAAQHAIESAGLNNFFLDVIFAGDGGGRKTTPPPYFF